MSALYGLHCNCIVNNVTLKYKELVLCKYQNYSLFLQINYILLLKENEMQYYFNSFRYLLLLLHTLLYFEYINLMQK